jgi:hypothetical protein
VDSTATLGAKLKYKTVVKIDAIPDYRIKDYAFWTQYFTLWLNPVNNFRDETDGLVGVRVEQG